MNDFQRLVKDLRARGIPYELNILLPCPVRHRAALRIALGYLCERGEERGELGRRVLLALKKIHAIGQRSRFADWFHG